MWFDHKSLTKQKPIIEITVFLGRSQFESYELANW